MDNIITKERIDAYCLSLLADERSAGTIQKYRRDLAAFARWIGGAEITKEAASRKPSIPSCRRSTAFSPI